MKITDKTIKGIKSGTNITATKDNQLEIQWLIQYLIQFDTSVPDEEPI